jgi:hypothetical protein
MAIAHAAVDFPAIGIIKSFVRTTHPFSCAKTRLAAFSARNTSSMVAAPNARHNLGHDFSDLGHGMSGLSLLVSFFEFQLKGRNSLLHFLR